MERQDQFLTQYHQPSQFVRTARERVRTAAIALLAACIGCTDPLQDPEEQSAAASRDRTEGAKQTSQGGKGGKVSEAGRGGSSGGARAQAEARAGGQALAAHEDRVLGDACAFVSGADWRTIDGDELLTSCKDGIGLLPWRGGNFRMLARAPNADALALSSSRLMYLDAKQLLFVPLTGGAAEVLAIDVIDNLQFSEDRKLAVFERARSSDGQLPVYALDTDATAQGQRQIALAEASGSRLLPGGHRLLFSPSYGELAIADVLGTAPQSTRLGKGSISKVIFSESGKQLAFYDTDNKHVVVAQADGSSVQLGDASSDALEPVAFSLDESAVVAVYNDYNFKTSRTALMQLDGDSAVTNIAQDKNCNGASFGKSGSVLTLQTIDNTSSSELWLASNGKNTMLATLERCFGDLARPTVSADATRAAFVDVYGTFTVVDMSDGTRIVELPKQVPAGATCYAAPAWSADNRQVLLSSCKNGKSDCEVFTIDTETRQRGAVFGTTRAESAAFSPDSRYVAYSNSSGDLELHDAHGPLIVKAYSNQYHWLDAGHFVYSAASAKRELHLFTLK